MDATETAPPTAQRRRTIWYFFLLSLACLIWSAQGTAIKFLDRQLGPVAITFLPFYLTTVLMVPLLLASVGVIPAFRRPAGVIGASSPSRVLAARCWRNWA